MEKNYIDYKNAVIYKFKITRIVSLNLTFAYNNLHTFTTEV